MFSFFLFSTTLPAVRINLLPLVLIILLIQLYYKKIRWTVTGLTLWLCLQKCSWNFQRSVLKGVDNYGYFVELTISLNISRKIYQSSFANFFARFRILWPDLVVLGLLMYFLRKLGTLLKAPKNLFWILANIFKGFSRVNSSGPVFCNFVPYCV